MPFSTKVENEAGERRGVADAPLSGPHRPATPSVQGVIRRKLKKSKSVATFYFAVFWSCYAHKWLKIRGFRGVAAFFREVRVKDVDPNLF